MFSVSAKQSQVTADLVQGVENILAGAAYQHVEEEGPRLTKVSSREEEELVAPYFTSPELASLQEEISLCWREALRETSSLRALTQHQEDGAEE